MWYRLERKQVIPFGVRRLSAEDVQHIRFQARVYRLLSVLLMVILPFAFIGCIACGSGLPERMPFIVIVVGGTVAVPTIIAAGAWVGWERSRALYRDWECRFVLQSVLDGAIIERLPNSNRIWSISGEIAASHPDIDNAQTSLYLWPDMLPGTVRSMTLAERLEICWIFVQDILFLAGIGWCLFGCARFAEFLDGYRNLGWLWSAGIFCALMAIFFLAMQLFVLAILKLIIMLENRWLPLDLLRGEVRRYYNMVSGKEIEILPCSGRPWTIGDEPFIWRRESRWK